MKEFLNIASGEYKQAECMFSHSNWIEIPKGAEVAMRYKSGEIEFFKENYAYFWFDKFKEWKSTKNAPKFYESAFIIWQRPTQPEPLPFIDDNPQSLNDQYAEIEQVRQNQKTIDAMREAEGILSSKKLKGMKYDNDKPRHSLLPKGTVNAVINVLEFGAKKYEANNWKKVDNAKERYYNAAMRHIDRWWNGEKRDPETNIHHLAHAATSLFFLIWFDENGEQ